MELEIADLSSNFFPRLETFLNLWIQLPPDDFRSNSPPWDLLPSKTFEQPGGVWFAKPPPRTVTPLRWRRSPSFAPITGAPCWRSPGHQCHGLRMRKTW